MESGRIGLGIVGCSTRSQSLLSELLPALGEERIGTLAVFDPIAAKVESWVKCLGRTVKVCESLEELLGMSELAWVAVTSWNALHARQAVQALAAGKHVFCEKPLTTSLDDALLLREAAQRSDRLFLVGFTLRYSSFYREMKELLISGRIGKVISMEFNETLNFNHGGHIMSCWRRLEQFTGSHILEKCCHDIDVANWLLESRPRKVASFGGRNFFIPENAHLPETLPRDAKGERPYCQWPTARGGNPFLTDKDIVDNQVVIMEYANGARATFHTNLNAGIPERRFYILGERGAIRGDMQENSIELCMIGFDAKSEIVFSKPFVKEGHGGADQVLCRHWADLMCGRAAAPLSTVVDGLTSAAACFAIEKARKEGRIVDLAEVWNQLDAK